MERQNDLTQGSVTKQLLRYALPLVASSLMQSLYSIADMIAAGHFIGSAGQSAITNSSQVINLMTQIAIGITVGGNVLISSLYGQQKDGEREKSVGYAFFPFGASRRAVFYRHFSLGEGRRIASRRARADRIRAVSENLLRGHGTVFSV